MLTETCSTISNKSNLQVSGMRNKGLNSLFPITNDCFNGFEDTPEFNEFNKEDHYIDEIQPFFESQSEGIGFEHIPEHLRGLSSSELLFQ